MKNSYYSIWILENFKSIVPEKLILFFVNSWKIQKNNSWRTQHYSMWVPEEFKRGNPQRLIKKLILLLKYIVYSHSNPSKWDQHNC
jgi:hypothetical protein